MLSAGVYRHLSQCSNGRGIFVILAIDHRDNLVASLQEGRTQPVSYADVVAFKRSVTRHVAGAATAVLTDPDYGWPGLTDRSIPGHVGLLAPLEVTDYRLHPAQSGITFIPDWTVARIKQAGCSGVKLLMYYHPDAPNARRQTEMVDRIVEQCQAHHIPLFLEPICYSLNPARPLQSEERRQIVVANARHFSARGIDVLKAEFPVDVRQEPDEAVWKAALRELDAACSVPWALLSAGVSFDVFLRQTTLACAAGASGVIAGRAVWAEATALDGEAREQFLAATARERMERLAGACHALGRPWMERHLPPDVRPRWYAEAEQPSKVGTA